MQVQFSIEYSAMYNSDMNAVGSIISGCWEEAVSLSRMNANPSGFGSRAVR